MIFPFFGIQTESVFESMFEIWPVQCEIVQDPTARKQNILVPTLVWIFQYKHDNTPNTLH